MSPPTVTLYSRPGCHLCDEARSILNGLREEGLEFELAEIDIDSDDDLLRSHLERIPVIELGGNVIGELVPDATELRARIGTVAP